jgi:hypothetical protein
MTLTHALVFAAIFLLLVALTARNCNGLSEVMRTNALWKG